MLSADLLSPLPAPATVLLVEDEPVIRLLLAEALRGTGLRVAEAGNADEAWSYLEAGGVAHLIISDITMPGSMNGTELLRRVSEGYPHIKRVITSANPGQSSLAAFGHFLPKPYRLETAAQVALDMLGLPAA